MRRVVLLLVFLLGSLGWAVGQQRTVTGVVTSAEDGSTLPQLSVMVKGTQTGVVTDLDGRYSIRVSGPEAVLVFAYTGFTTQEVPVGERSEINVAMPVALEAIDEVVVTAYGTAKKESLVGAQSAVTAREMEKRPLTNISSALAATAPGVQTTTSTGQPGSSTSVRIRGFGSINASDAPLYVVDGAVYTGALSDLQQADILSLTVLKDAASTALYGSSAGNGVILITTRSGRGGAGKPNFNFTTNQGFSMKGAPEYEKVGAKDWLSLIGLQYYNQYTYEQPKDDLWRNALTNAAVATQMGIGYEHAFGDMGTYIHPDDSTVVNVRTGIPQHIMADGSLNPAVGDVVWADDTDWNKALFRLGYRHEYTLSGGYNTDQLRSYMSLSYLNEDGYRIFTNMNRFSARANVSYDVKKWFSVGTNTSISRRETTSPKRGDGSYSANSFLFASRIAPIYPIHHHDSTGSIGLNEDGNYFDYSQTRPFSKNFNPVLESEIDLSTSAVDAITNRSFAEVRFLPGLSFKTNVAYDLLRSQYKMRYNSIMGDQPQGLLYVGNYRYTTVTFNQLLEWNQEFDKHAVNVLLGHENYLYHVLYNEMGKELAAVPGIDELSNYGKMSSMESSTTNYRKEGYFGRVSYSYDSRYNASVSYRRDGSSRFAPAKRWGNFWSVGFGWNIHREAFMESIVNVLPELKLRASVGQTGNDGLSSYYPHMTLFAGGYTNYMDHGRVFNVAGNPNLLWESQMSYDVALEFNVLNRIAGTVEFFNKESYDLLFDRPVPYSSGVTSISDNLGKVRNYGVEMDLRFTVLDMENLRWDITMNGTWLKNVLVRLPEHLREKGFEVPNSFKKYEEGRSIYDFYMREYLGVDKRNGRAMYRIDSEEYPLPDPSTMSPEDYRAAVLADRVGLSGDSLTMTYNSDLGKKDFWGSSIPDFYGGFGTSLTFYGVDVNVLFSYQIGGRTYDGGYQGIMGRQLNAGRAIHKDMLNSWKKPGDDSDIPMLTGGAWGQYDNASSNRYLISSSALSLRSVSVGYTLPRRWANYLDLSSVRVSVAGENLFMVSKRKGLNPMAYYGGEVGAAFYDFARVFTASLSINF